ncbi:collagen alpha-1(XIV) chain-like [Pseudoliparis swirei]|uniref:collagen alpha-1(XIV) chain-like n=1 Tax=Pseudoliparis swirei TaxID=2059687 RepID=UPI0024BE9C0D|nr:collagen alpha-1(XIV) chain-like [Pseudoliparis swirei]
MSRCRLQNEAGNTPSARCKSQPSGGVKLRETTPELAPVGEQRGSEPLWGGTGELLVPPVRRRARRCIFPSAAPRMHFSVGPSLGLLAFVLVSLLPQPAGGQGGEQRQVEVSKQEAKLLIEDFDPLKEYNFHIVAVSGDQQSRPLTATHEARQAGLEMVQSQQSEDGGGGEDNNEISEAEDEFTCKTSSISDIVILVDGSWSIGRINFRLVRTFLENLVRAFSVEFDQTRIGLAQYSGDPRIEWHLNTHTTKESVLEAVKNLPYKGGNTLTGLALTYILETSFKPESGSRPGVPKIGILITDGKSQDDVIPPAQSLREAGIELFAIGVKNADESELKAIASPPEETHVYNVADFNVMSDIVDGLAQSVCERVEQLDKQLQGGEPAPPPVSVATPSNLVTSDITARSFRVTWTHAAGQVEKYRVVYYPASGGQPDEKNYGEAEDDDPYRYYESSYPAPRPVAPGDPAAYAQDDPAVRRRRARSGEGEEAGETQ